ncbi:tripartite tricarboxylate transporter permease [Psychrobacillus sp. NPDC093180]|uniref:tripartite tricarboxylate transporter permease n=1 Tax=Psychrobacillus sp. NPDC093180 TaxID=3364489 RepID=UPI0038125E13
MDIFGFDISALFSWGALLAIILGTIYGLFIGALPGLGATVGIALILPFTYTMEPLSAILLLVAVYQACEYGGSITSIVLGIPGNPAATATILDGLPMARAGKPGKALGYSLYASTFGGLVGAIMLMTLTIPLASIAIKFGDPEFFLLGTLGIILVAGLSSKDIPKSIISVLLGLLLGTIGLDGFTGSARFTFGNLNLLEGISMVALLVGIFAVSEVLLMIGELHKRYVTETKNLKTSLTWKEFKYVGKNTITGSLIGSFVGVLPGLGAGPASWFAYTQAKRTSKNPQDYGKGEPNGIAAPEASNNAAVGGALVPLLTLGIPGSPATAVILGAFFIQGIQPGPKVFSTDPELVYGIFWGFLIATLAMYFFGKYTTSLWARMLILPNKKLVPIILIIALVGVYASAMHTFDVWVAIIAGIIAFLLNKLDFSLPSFILAFILGPIIEISLRRTLSLSDGSLSIFFTRGYSLAILGIMAILIITMIIANKKQKQMELKTNDVQ